MWKRKIKVNPFGPSGQKSLSTSGLFLIFHGRPICFVFGSVQFRHICFYVAKEEDIIRKKMFCWGPAWMMRRLDHGADDRSDDESDEDATHTKTQSTLKK